MSENREKPKERPEGKCGRCWLEDIHPSVKGTYNLCVDCMNEIGVRVGPLSPYSK